METVLVDKYCDIRRVETSLVDEYCQIRWLEVGLVEKHGRTRRMNTDRFDLTHHRTEPRAGRVAPVERLAGEDEAAPNIPDSVPKITDLVPNLVPSSWKNSRSGRAVRNKAR